MIRRPPRSTRTDTLFPYTTLFLSARQRSIADKGRGDRMARDKPHDEAGAGARIAEIKRRVRFLQPADPHAIDGPDALAIAQLLTCTRPVRSEEHTSELQSLMRNSYAVFCLKKKKHRNNLKTH